MSHNTAEPTRLLQQTKKYCARNQIELKTTLSGELRKKETDDDSKEEAKAIVDASDRNTSSEYSQGENSDYDRISSK